MAKTSHAAGTKPDAPTSSQLAELHRQIGSGKITKGSLQEFLRGGTESPVWTKSPLPRVIDAQYPDLNDARKIVGQRNFFGPNQWLKHFGKAFSIPKTPTIPWTSDQLAGIVSKAPHFLFLGTDALGRRPLTLHNMVLRFSTNSHPKMTDLWYSDELIAHDAVELRWYLIPIGTQISVGDNDEYGFTRPSARAIANVLFYYLNRKYLDSDAWALCSGFTDKGNNIYIRGFLGDQGIRVYRPTGVTKAAFGHAIDRKSGK